MMPKHNTSSTPYEAQLPPELVAVFALAKGRVRPGGHWIHGPAHWLKVAQNGKTLAEATDGADASVAQMFGLLHDCERRNDEHDPQHGPRAAVFAQKLFDQGKLPLTEPQLSLLKLACERHDLGEVSDDPTLGVCWDADRLELPRVGIRPDPKFFSTAAGRRLISVK